MEYELFKNDEPYLVVESVDVAYNCTFTSPNGMELSETDASSLKVSINIANGADFVGARQIRKPK